MAALREIGYPQPLDRHQDPCVPLKQRRLLRSPHETRGCFDTCEISLDIRSPPFTLFAGLAIMRLIVAKAKISSSYLSIHAGRKLWQA